MSMSISGHKPREFHREQSEHQYLVFLLGNEMYGVPLVSIREVTETKKPTPIPGVPEWFLGVLNIRGEIHSVVDLRKRFKVPSITTEKTPSLVFSSNALAVIAIVDSLHSVMRIEPNEITSEHNLKTRVNNRFIDGIATRDNEIIFILKSELLIESDTTILGKTA